ncbi:MAG: hypothetical protein ABSF14_14180 [Terriglobia bacterium]|jgi:hypothetical protein
MADKRSPEMIAVEAVHAALLPLEADARKRVLRSVYALLDVVMEDSAARLVATGTVARPISIVELIREKQPGTSAQRIVLFAYYREKHEGLARFGRRDLEPYFGKAKESPATNYDRDFVEAVKKGWIHEDGENSYITSRGIEAVEASFAGERKYAKGPRKPAGKARRAPKAKKMTRRNRAEA